MGEILMVLRGLSEREIGMIIKMARAGTEVSDSFLESLQKRISQLRPRRAAQKKETPPKGHFPSTLFLRSLKHKLLCQQRKGSGHCACSACRA